MNESTRDPRNGPPTVEHLLAGGELLGSQTQVRTTWSPEKRLAAAALAAGLMTIRNHYGDPVHCQHVEEDLAWVASPVDDHPFSFLALCGVFDLDPAWVRETVERWKGQPRSARAPFVLHRHAA